MKKLSLDMYEKINMQRYNKLTKSDRIKVQRYGRLYHKTKNLVYLDKAIQIIHKGNINKRGFAKY